jgi:fructosamine-3-kinase
MADAPAIAAHVERLLGEPVRGVERVTGGDICEAWRIELDGRPVFAKSLADAPGILPAEAVALEWLGEPEAVPVAQVVAVDEEVLVLEWIEPGHRTDPAEELLGRGLAAVHRAGAPTFGSPAPGGVVTGFVDSLGLDDLRADTWVEFFVKQRLRPLVAEADRRGVVPAGTAARAERLAERVAGLAGPPEPPARLHGDLWAGNVVWGRDDEPWLIDPNAHGGHRETDLAMMRLFGGFGPRTFGAYQEVFPLAEGWEDRVALHQLHPLLVHACLFGAAYGAQVDAILRRYLA